MKRYMTLAALLLAGCAQLPSQPADASGTTVTAEVTADTAADITAAAETTADTTVTTVETYDSSGVQGTPTSTWDEYAWAEAYREQICSDDIGYVPDMFSLYDMTGDGIPELILSEGDWHGARVKIYTVHDTDVSVLSPDKGGDLGSWGTVLYSPSENIILSSFMNMGATDMDFYRVDGDGIKHELSAFRYDGMDYGEDEYTQERTIDGEACTSEEYDRIMQEYTFADYIVLGRHHKTGEDMLRRMYGDEDYESYAREKYADFEDFDETVSGMQEGIYPGYQRVKLEKKTGDYDQEYFTVDGHLYEYAEADKTFADMVTEEYSGIENDLTAGVYAYGGGIYFLSAGHKDDGVREYVYSFDEGECIMDDVHDIIDGRYYTDGFEGYMSGEQLISFNAYTIGI